MRFRFVRVATIAFVLTGCQSDANMQWERIGPGPTLEYADAQCNIMAMGVQQNTIAIGSPGFVLGSQLGDAVATGMMQAQFKKNCMTMQGWKQVPKAKPAAASTMSAATRKTATQLLMIGIVSDRCGWRLSSEGRAGVAQARQMATSAMRQEAKLDADQKMNGAVAAVGKAEYCKRAKAIAKESGLLA